MKQIDLLWGARNRPVIETARPSRWFWVKVYGGSLLTVCLFFGAGFLLARLLT